MPSSRRRLRRAPRSPCLQGSHSLEQLVPLRPSHVLLGFPVHDLGPERLQPRVRLLQLIGRRLQSILHLSIQVSEAPTVAPRKAAGSNDSGREAAWPVAWARTSCSLASSNCCSGLRSGDVAFFRATVALSNSSSQPMRAWRSSPELLVHRRRRRAAARPVGTIPGFGQLRPSSWGRWWTAVLNVFELLLSLGPHGDGMDFPCLRRPVFAEASVGFVEGRGLGSAPLSYTAPGR